MSIRLPQHARIVANLDPLLVGLCVAAASVTVVAWTLRPAPLDAALRSTAGPFATLAAVVALGILADRLGLFGLLSRAVVPARAGPRVTAAAVLAFAAVLSASTNLDVAAVVAMPVALGALGGGEGMAPSPWLAVAVAATVNAASFLLPTSNVTNLLILSRSSIGPAGYLRDSWLPWLVVTGLTVTVLAPLAGRGSRLPSGHRDPRVVRSSSARIPVRMLADLVPLFFAASALRALMGGGFRLPGGAVGQAAAGSVLAAALNNLPVAASVQPVHASVVWPAVLAMSIGPNLLLWGSLATLLCRRIAVANGARLDGWRFSLMGAALVPVQIAIALIALRVAGTV